MDPFDGSVPHNEDMDNENSFFSCLMGVSKFI